MSKKREITLIGQTYKIGDNSKVFVKRGKTWVFSNNYTSGELRLHFELETLKAKFKALNADYKKLKKAAINEA